MPGYNPPTPASIGAVPTSRQVIAGTNMTGGGPLTADVTVNSTGGGGGSTTIFSQPPTDMKSFDSGANACMGNIVILKEAVTVSFMYITLKNGLIGNIYNGFIATIDTATKAIIATVGTTPSFTTTAIGGQTIKLVFAAPIVLAAGAYLFGAVKTNSTTTAQGNIIYGSIATSYPSLPIDAGAMFEAFTSSDVACVYATNNSSPNAVAVNGTSLTAIYAIGVGFTF